MSNPIKNLTKKEWALWLTSLAVVIASNLLTGSVDPLTLAAACVGITSLIFAAKGNVWSQILMILFSLLYGVISWQVRYWGEMITYLGMTLPMAVWSTVTWLRNPADNGKAVAIRRLTAKHIAGLAFFCTLTTWVFYLILRALDTPNIAFSTISVATSFLAASLTMLRTSYYALGYASNDLVLIVLWMLASLKNPLYIPVVVNFTIFFVNDMYGFISWRKREQAALA
ncbi:nicotinamide riboside transporter PnuC [Gemmiger sp.]